MVSALVAMPGAVAGPLAQPSEPGMEHRVVIDIPLLPRQLQSGISAEGSEQGEERGRPGDDSGYDEPSIAVCVGNSHKVRWRGDSTLHADNTHQLRENFYTEQKRAQIDHEAEVEGFSAENDRAAGSGTGDQSCTEKQDSDDKQCKGPTNINGNNLDNGKGDDEKQGLAASSRDDAAGVEMRSIDAASAENTKVEAPYSDDVLAERICTHSVNSGRTAKILEGDFGR